MTPFELAGVLVTCLETAFAEDADAPAEICQRPGDQVPFQFGVGVDECCSGLAWVRIQQIDPVIDPITMTSPDFNPCSQAGKLVTFELGVVRCNPSGIVTCEQWTERAARIDLDATAMRRAVCCAATTVVTDDTFVTQILPGSWTPLESSGGCIGGSMTVTAMIECEDC